MFQGRQCETLGLGPVGTVLFYDGVWKELINYWKRQ